MILVLRELVRFALALGVMIGFGLSLLFLVERPAPRLSWLVWAVPIATVLGFGLIVALTLWKGPAPDYLARIAKGYFNRSGFAFAPRLDSIDGRAVFTLYFQNQFERPCVGRVALRPAQGFWLTRPEFEAVCFEIPCEGGSFGVATVAVPIPEKMRGRTQKFEVGASVHYPDGKGRALRYGQGTVIRTNEKFGNNFHTGLAVAAALSGGVLAAAVIASQRRPMLKCKIPADASSFPLKDAGADVFLLWKWGDPEVPLDDLMSAKPKPVPKIPIDEV